MKPLENSFKNNQPKLLAFDFDGVLTDNKVIVNSEGIESVSCSRADGLAFDFLRSKNFPTYVISTEANPVVIARCKKLKIPLFNDVKNKVEIVQKISKKEKIALQDFLFVGNDLNDFKVMKICGASACPLDAHPKIKEIATFIIERKGGEGVVRELLENILQFNILDNF